MANCIYRNVPINNNVPQDKDTASVEHIIPWALGGSNGLVTSDASKGANNDLGSEVDARFANTLPLAIKRHHLQLKSQNGNIEPIVWPAETIDGGKASITIDHLGNVGAKLRVSVQTPDGSEGGKMVIKGEREQVEPIIKGMLAKWMAKGISAYSEDGKLLTSLDDFFEESDQQDVDQFRARVEYFNKEAWTRGILKIALGVGHLILGREWTFGRDADVLRQYVLNSKDNWPTTGRGYLAGEWHRSLRLSLGKTKAVLEANQHTVAVLPRSRGGGGLLVISLFGGDGVPEAAINIGQLPQAMLDALNREDNHSVTMGYRVDPNTRITTPIVLSEIDGRIARFGPTNNRSVSVYRWRDL